VTSAVAETAGLFGPASVAWRVDRELIVLAGGSCAPLMQAAHPVVASGVVEHSAYATDPFGRLKRTLTSSFDVVFGDRARADAAIRRVNAIHASVRGRLPDGAPYSALDPEALLWVHATLVDTALRVYSRFVEPLSAADEQAYHEEAARVAIALGIASSDLPDRLTDLRAWMDGMVEGGGVRVTPNARRIARTVLRPIGWVPGVAWEAAHLVSLATLPEPLRRQYGLRWSAARERGVDRLAALSRHTLPLLPPVLRFAPQARHARRRVRQALEARPAIR
jgi:uncharacterized protein (DUF2236 family)